MVAAEAVAATEENGGSGSDSGSGSGHSNRNLTAIHVGGTNGGAAGDGGVFAPPLPSASHPPPPIPEQAMASGIVGGYQKSRNDDMSIITMTI